MYVDNVLDTYCLQ